jgi:DNA-binding beta-propeller fold protein YncE
VASVKHWSFPPDGIKAPAPRAVAVSPNGDVFVLDNAARVLVFDGSGNFLRLWRMPDSGLGNPQGVRVLRDGRVVVADTHYSRLVFFDTEGKELGRLGEFGKEQGQFIYPIVVAQDDAENIYVGEYGDHDRIQKFAKDGTFLLEFGSFGTEPGQFQRPSGIVWHAQKIFVADAFNNRIQIFADDGRFLGILSDEKSPVELNYPYDLVLDSRSGTSDPNFLLVEYGGNCVTQLSPNGRLLGRFGSEGSGIGQLVTPWRLAIHPQTGSVIVMDTGNRRIVELK